MTDRVLYKTQIKYVKDDTWTMVCKEFFVNKNNKFYYKSIKSRSQTTINNEYCTETKIPKNCLDSLVVKKFLYNLRGSNKLGMTACKPTKN